MSQHLAKNTVFMTAASIGQKIVAFVYFLFLARVMMPEKTGTFFLATSIITMFSVFSDLGVTSVLIREISKRPEARDQIVRQAIGLKLFLTIATVVIIFIATPFFQYDTEITGLILMTSLVMITDALALICYGILRASQQLRHEAFGMFIGQCVTVCVGGISLVLYPDVRFLILALICGSAATFLISFSQVVRLYGFHLFIPSWDKQAQWNMVKIMLPFALAGIFVKIYSTLDVILISKMLSTTAVGIYSVAYKFTYAFQFLPLAFAAALYPSLSSTVDKDVNVTTKTFSQAIWYTFLIATPITFGVSLLAPEMIQLIGREYGESSLILQTLIFVLFPSFLEVSFGALLNASDRQSTRMKIIGFAMVINAGIDFVLIPRLGLMGAVIGSLISYSIMVFIEFIIVSKILPQFLTRQFFLRTSGTILSGLVMFSIGVLLKQWMSWFLVIPCAAAVYFGMLIITKSVTKQEILRFKALFRKTPVVV
jgi:O-antigen/teichoic acid export membrane protein